MSDDMLRLIGQTVVDSKGRRRGIVVGRYKESKRMIQVVAWDRGAKDYFKYYWDKDFVFQLPTYPNADSTDEVNAEDETFLEWRKLALADAALIVDDRQMFEEAFAEPKVILIQEHIFLKGNED